MPSRPLTALASVSAAALLGCGASHVPGTASRQHRPAPPSVLAGEIDRAQATIDDRSAASARLQKAARFEQLAFGELAARPGLRRATVGRLSPAARSAASAAIRSADALAKIVPAERRFPHWRILAPPPAGQLLEDFRGAAAAYRLSWQYLAAIELVETRMGRIHGLSPAGAQGPMQFMPSTWAEYGRGSIDNERDAIRAAARFLAANGGAKHIRAALFHYNPSRFYVLAVATYAQEMERDERAFYAYHAWQVLYRTLKGVFLLPVGYPHVPARRI